MWVIWVPLPNSSLKFRVNVRVNFFVAICFSCTDVFPEVKRRTFWLKFGGYIGGGLIFDNTFFQIP